MAKFKFLPFESTADNSVLAGEDYEASMRFGDVSVGERYVFYPSLMHIRYISIQDIVWSYMRREEKLCVTGCRRTLVPRPFLMIVLETGKVKKIPFAEDRDIRDFLDAVKERNAGISIGYTDELKEKFMRKGV